MACEITNVTIKSGNKNGLNGCIIEFRPNWLCNIDQIVEMGPLDDGVHYFQIKEIYLDRLAYKVVAVEVGKRNGIETKINFDLHILMIKTVKLVEDVETINQIKKWMLYC
jgi:hypothetical protein